MDQKEVLLIVWLGHRNILDIVIRFNYILYTVRKKLTVLFMHHYMEWNYRMFHKVCNILKYNKLTKIEVKFLFNSTYTSI